jgi:hypothetical protein
MGSLIHDWRYLLSKLASLTCRYQPSCQQAMLIDTAGQCGGSTHAMPAFMPTRLEIDLATGQIKNWTVPTGEQLQCIADSHTSHPTTPISKSKQIDIEEAIEEAISASQREQGVIETLMQIEDAIAADTTEPAKQLDQVYVWFDASSDRWTAETHDHAVGEHSATSQQGKFEAIKNVLKKAGLMGVYEINQCDLINDIEFYGYDNTRTKDRTIVYVGGHEIGKSHTARTSVGGKKYTAPTESAALDGLLLEVLKIELPEDAIVDTTDDEMVFNDKQRFSIDMTRAIEIRDPAVKSDTVADAPEPICHPSLQNTKTPSLAKRGQVAANNPLGSWLRSPPVAALPTLVLLQMWC